jgi:hypothetical protein
MSTIHLHQTTTSTPEQYVAGLTDFGPGRSKLFGNSADQYLKVHHRGPSEADVTEGSGGIWERLHYDWSDSNRVVLTTTDSNTWGGASGHTYTFTRNPNGTTDIDVVVVRDGKNLKGRLLGFVLGTVGRAVLERRLRTPSRPLKPGTVRQQRDSHHEPDLSEFTPRCPRSHCVFARPGSWSPVKGGWTTQARFWLEWGSSTDGQSVPATGSRFQAIHSNSISIRPSQWNDVTTADLSTPKITAPAMICSSRGAEIEEI